LEKEMGTAMKQVWLVADSVISPLGLTSEENFNSLVSGRSGSKKIQEEKFGAEPVWAAHMPDIISSGTKTRFEILASMALGDLQRQVAVPTSRTLFVLSTTKGNIEVLETGQPNHPRISLHATAHFLAAAMSINKSLVVSNACTSGAAALIAAKRFIESGEFDHAIVLGADTINRFVVSGFQSLNALSSEPCRPFDKQRCGINLGEAASAVLLTAQPQGFGNKNRVSLLGGAITNDANHISGPSKTGEELAFAIERALAQSNVSADNIDFISAHGTATIYNDEMEAKAFYLSGLSQTPLHSLKGNYGHTLGAAGVVETVMSIHSLLQHELIPSFGFENSGVSQPINPIRKREQKKMRMALKTASGFGGCNAALVLALEN
jgi:3-oxoacyl-[acyl-carrier-protein] synthase I